MKDVIDYHGYVDKTGWGDGPWQGEADKRQFVDDETGMSCLVVRNNAGNLCGYVGVRPGHPFYGIGYSYKVDVDQVLLKEAIEGKGYADLYAEEIASGRASPETVLTVHGGITFADGCHEIDREDWEKWVERAKGRKDEARKYPRGDAARLLKERATELEDYDRYKAWAEASFICHRPSSDDDPPIWWLGFDTSHAGDYSPAIAGQYVKLGMPTGWGSTVEYRDMDYVVGEIRKLAVQLRKIGDAMPGTHRLISFVEQTKETADGDDA